MEKNKTAMQDFLIHIREKRNILTRDWQNGHGHYYVVRIFEMLEAECFGRLDKEKEQIIDAHGVKSRGGFKANGEFFQETKTGEEYYNETYANDTTKGLPEEDSKRRAWHY